jgi:hypothetical protein
MTLTRRGQRVLTVGLVGALGLGGGTALAVWHTTGSGSGGAAVGNNSPVTLEATSGTPSSKLIPGGTADLLIQISNPNAFAVTLTGVSTNGAVTSTVPACDSGGNGVSVPTQTGLSITIPSGSNQLVHVPAGIAMSSASVSACQGATFRAPVTITVRQ